MSAYRLPLQPTSHEIWQQKYQLKDQLQRPIDQDLDAMFVRTATALANQESDPSTWFPRFLWALRNGATPAGRILSNAGAEAYKPAVSLINCTVSEIVEDSMDGILRSNHKAGLTLKAGCGIGYEWSTLRPRNAFVSGAGAFTSGPLSFMDIFDATCFTVSSAGGRRGAQMGTMAVWHPDVIDFIKSKREDGKFRQFNLSLLIDDDFMAAVKANESWQLVFPVTQKELDTLGIPLDHESLIYKDLFWEEDYCSRMGYTVTNGRILCKIYHTLPAIELYDIIMKSTYDFAEPGFLLIDKINKYNNNYFCEEIRATNPCLHPDSLVETVNGRVRIKDITEPTMVYTMLPDGSLGIRKASASWVSKRNAATIKVTVRTGKSVTCTPDHLIYVEGFGWKKAEDLKVGDKLVHLCRTRRGTKYSGVKLSTEDNRAYRMEHRMIADAVWGLNEDDDVRHINEDTYDNAISNLEVLSHSSHSTPTRDSCPNDHQVKDSYGKWASTDSDYMNPIIPMPDSMSSNMKNSSGACVVSIEEGPTTDVYDLTVEDTHNFIADFIVVHNCGEQPLPPNGSCLLGSINLAYLVDNPFTPEASFNWDTYTELIHVFSRMLDNVVELNGLPLPEQRHEIEYKRRHGMGFTGLGSAMSLLGLQYGSPESIKFTSEISKVLAIESYRAGIALAKEKGPAPIFNDDFTYRGTTKSAKQWWVEGNFMRKVFSEAPDLYNDALTYGCRYTHATSIAPTGTISLTVNNNVSNGIEPTFTHKYTRNVIKEGKKSKVAVDVYSYELLLYKHLTGIDEAPESFSTTDNVSPKAHVDIQAAAQYWCDSSISKTINVPTDTKFEDFKDIYMYAYDQGLKGCTTFRFNPEALQGVLVKQSDLETTSYIFTLADGTEVTANGDDQIIYDGEVHQANNLYDAIKEGYYGKF